MPSGRSFSPWVSAFASIVPLCSVSVTGFRGGSDILDSLGICRLVLSRHSLSLRYSMRLSARPSLVAIGCCRLVPSSYLLPFRLTDTVCRVACLLLPGFPPPLLSSISTLSALQVSVVVPSGSLLRHRVESSRCGPPSGSSLSQSSIGMMALPPPSWCLVGLFAMWSP